MKLLFCEKSDGEENVIKFMHLIAHAVDGVIHLSHVLYPAKWRDFQRNKIISVNLIHRVYHKA